MLSERLKLTTIKQTSKQYNAVKSQLTRNDVKEIIIATDAGREGKLVARWISERAKVNKPVKYGFDLLPIKQSKKALRI